jgi:starch synthase
MTRAAMADAALRVLFVAAESAPLVKTGGLADVSAALPLALQRIGVDVRVLLPGYPAVVDALGVRPTGPSIGALANAGATRIFETELPNGVPLLVVDHPWLFERPGGPYQDPSGSDWIDNALRFGLFGKVAALLAGDASPFPWRPDVIHANDWHAALAPAYLRLAPPTQPCATVLTVHNLAYQGIFARPWLDRLELPSSLFTPDGIEYYGSMSFLKAGLRFADAITTVSPTYAREIQTGPLGFGLDGVLRARRDALVGIVNGIDTDEWNPASDPLIARHYDGANLGAKVANREALQTRLGLAAMPSAPLFGVVSRLVPQKGIDLVADIAERLVDLPAQLVVLGAGDADLEQRFLALATRHPGRIAVQIGFDNALAHQIEAGSDAFLMPSRFEPCGMNQMYSQRYGTLPIVRRTGGLEDTVVDCTPETLAAGTATGFVFDVAGADDLLAAVRRAATTFADVERWRKVQRNAMARDFSWDAAARRYARTYACVAPTSAPPL